MTLLLTDSDLESLLDPLDVIEAVESQFSSAAAGRTLQVVPEALELPGRSDRFLAMVALADEPRLVSVKLLADLPDVAAGQSAQRSTIMLVDAVSGVCRAVLAGRVPTRDRTAAASSVASRHLARPGSRTLGLVGAGALAVAHAYSHAALMDLDEILVWSRTPATVHRFLEQTAALGVSVCSVPEARDVFDADIVCTVTRARTPVVSGHWFRPGQHINVVGAPPRPDHREVDDEAVRRARVFVDDLASALAKSGDIRIPLDRGVIVESAVSNELGAVILGKIPGRVDVDEVTLFDSIGLASQDLAISALLVEAAHAAGVGTAIDLSS